MNRTAKIYMEENGFTAYVYPKKIKHEINTEKFNGKEVVIITKYLGNTVNINIWYGETATLIGIYSFRYEKDRHYIITYENGELKARLAYTNKEAKQILKETPHKIEWDSFTENYDIQCGVCGNWASVPINGRVDVITPTGGGMLPSRINFVLSETETIYEGKIYKKVDQNNWYIKTFYNREQFDKLKEGYKHSDEEFWDDFDVTFDKLYHDASNKDNIKAVNKMCAGWRMPFKTDVFDYNGKAPVIGSYEKVVSPGWMSTENPEFIECPCCDTIHRIYSETTVYRKWDYKFKKFFRRGK